MGFFGLGGDACYQATKSGLQTFAESVWLEYRKQGVNIATLLLVGIEGSKSLEAKSSLKSRRLMSLLGVKMTPEKILRQTLKSVRRSGRPIIIPTHGIPLNTVFYFFLKVMHATRSRRILRMQDRLLNFFIDDEEARR